MEHYELVEKLTERANVTAEEAAAVLESCDWELLEAMIRLEREGKLYSNGAHAGTKHDEVTFEDCAENEQTEKDGPAARRERRGRLGALLKKLLRQGMENYLVVKREGKVLLELPVLIAGVLTLALFWLVVILLIIGLCTRCEFSLRGRELGTESINNGIHDVTDAAQDIVEQVRDTLGRDIAEKKNR